MNRGFVRAERDVEAHRATGDTAEERVVIDSSVGCERLEARVVRFAPGRSLPRKARGRDEVLYVASGRGTITVGAQDHPLEPDTGVFVADGEQYDVENPGPDELVVVNVSAPGEGAMDGRRRVTVRFADQPALPATPNREFRYLINQDAGCAELTQFVGLIPPGRAPQHSHTYDEIVYVIEGEGVLHMNDRETPLRPGTCIHLPPLHPHSLENTGATPMRVLGVFHPSGDPASRAPEPTRNGG